MSKRGDNIRKRKDGRWEGCITVGHKENGRPIIKSVFARTQKELLPKLILFKFEQFANVYFPIVWICELSSNVNFCKFSQYINALPQFL